MMVDCELNPGINPRLQPLASLDPNTILVDERTLLDRLSFAARYGDLIVFFDQHNQPNGNWRRFFLKDPLVLMSAISTTPYTPKHRLFLLLYDKLKNSRADWHYETLKTDPPNSKTQQLLLQLFALINGLFDDINDWLEQMNIGHKRYALRTFVEWQVQNNLGIQLGQLVELQKLVHFTCREVPAPDFAALDKYNPLWQTNMNSRSLTLLDPDSDDIVIDVDVLLRCQQIYHTVFGFYVQVVDSAKDSFNSLWDNLDESRDSYADTALLIAFSKLMEVQQAQLNQLSEVHLNFYYHDILQQTERPAEPDSAIVCLTLKAGSAPLLLLQGTQFDGGVDAEQQAQLFANQGNQWLNLAQVEQLQTLRYQRHLINKGSAKGSAKRAVFIRGQLFENPVKDVNKVIKDPQGQLRSWPLLGANSGTVLQQGLALASPLLSLSGGTRTITLTFTLSSSSRLNAADFNGSLYYLSTEKDWLAVPAELSVKLNVVTLVIELHHSDKPIRPFAKNPDGYSSDWPLFKWMLGDCLDLTCPPQLDSVDIDVLVEDFHGAQLYNDDGKLSADSAFLPFGPIPAQQSRFYLGCAEIFAKPLSHLSLDVSWDKLPGNMSEYYQMYNQYLGGTLSIMPGGPMVCLQGPFRNLGFKGTFSLYNDADLNWQAVTVTNSIPPQVDQVDQTGGAGQNIEITLFNNQPVAALVIPAPLPQLAAGSLFDFTEDALNSQTPNPSLLLTPLAFTQGPKPGFMQWQLTAPEQGFGFGLYAQVVTAVTQENAFRLMNAIAHPTSDGSTQTTEAPVAAPEPVEAPVADSTATTDDTADKKDVPAEAKKEGGLLSVLFGKKPLEEVVDAVEDVGQSVEGAVDDVVDAVEGMGTAVEGAMEDMVGALEDMAKMVNKQSTPGSTPDLLPLPNPPYAPKVAELSVRYQANKPVTLTSTSDYPCELFHYDSFGNYPVYRSALEAVIPQSPGITRPTKGIALVPGVAQGGCTYLALKSIQPPCNLSLYLELNQLVAGSISQGVTPKPPILQFYYLATSGWRVLQILMDATDGLKCSGIIEVFLPDDMAQDPTLLPFAKPADATTGKRGWLALRGPNEVSDYAWAVYLNTQAVKVSRQFQQPWTRAEAPQLAADSITGLVVPNPMVSAMVQPFAALAGSGLESQAPFYRRVSERIDNKNRVVAVHDFERLAYQSMPCLYYCKVLQSQNRQSLTRMMLVNGYDAAQISDDAFIPVVNGCQLNGLKQFFARRTSPMMRFELLNPAYETMTVTAQLRFEPNVAVDRICQTLAEELKIYLSPWIVSDLLQRDIEQPLDSAELMDFFTRHEAVDEVMVLSVLIDGQTLNSPFVIELKTDSSLLLSAPEHNITQALSQTESEAQVQGQAQTHTQAQVTA